MVVQQYLKKVGRNVHGTGDTLVIKISLFFFQSLA